MNFPRTIAISAMALVTTGVMDALAADVYSNDFSSPPGTGFPEWTSSIITFASEFDPPRQGKLPAPAVTNCDSPNGAQRFLGEFGGPKIGIPADPGYNHTRVEQSVSLTLTNLPPHRALKVSFDLYVLRSWDGNSPRYGQDRWSLDITDGPVLLATTFSNNPKVSREGSDQDYPQAKSAPWSGAASTNTLGCKFFGDSIYPLEFTFSHTGACVVINFRSSLFEGKGTPDEAWGLDNVRVSTTESGGGR